MNTKVESTKVICQCCNHEVTKLVIHDWYDIEGNNHEQQICESCNSILNSRCDIAIGDHLLPPWEFQVAFVRRRWKAIEKNSKKSCSTITYSKDMQDVPKITSETQKFDCHCLKCGNDWKSLLKRPKNCPCCKSSSWDRKYRRPDMIGAEK